MSAALTLEALALLIHAHRARLPEPALLAVESLARAEGASRTQIAAAVALADRARACVMIKSTPKPAPLQNIDVPDPLVRVWNIVTQWARRQRFGG